VFDSDLLIILKQRRFDHIRVENCNAQEQQPKQLMKIQCIKKGDSGPTICESETVELIGMITLFCYFMVHRLHLTYSMCELSVCVQPVIIIIM